MPKSKKKLDRGRLKEKVHSHDKRGQGSTRAGQVGEPRPGSFPPGSWYKFLSLFQILIQQKVKFHSFKSPAN